MTQEIVAFKAALLQTGRDFLKVNHIDPADWLNMRRSMNFAAGEPVLEDNPVPMAYSAGINKEKDPLGYAIDLLDLNAVHILAGRLCFFNVLAGRISTIGLTLPLKPLSFDEMKAMAESIDQSFRDAGYVFYRGNTGMTEQSFGKNRLYKLDTYGEWQLHDRDKLFEYSLQVATFDSYSNVDFDHTAQPWRQQGCSPNLSDVVPCFSFSRF